MKNIYEELKAEYFNLKAKKEQLNREIEKLISAKRETEEVMDEIEFMLTNHGTHVYEDFVENIEEGEE